ncbi:hypothetical protein BD310DRAFT_776670, partial [Dichomitus squalens]
YPVRHFRSLTKLTIRPRPSHRDRVVRTVNTFPNPSFTAGALLRSSAHRPCLQPSRPALSPHRDTPSSAEEYQEKGK